MVNKHNKELRLVEILVDGKWVATRLSDVKEGDSFRLFEDGVLLGEYVAMSAGYSSDEHGHPQLDTDVGGIQVRTLDPGQTGPETK